MTAKVFLTVTSDVDGLQIVVDRYKSNGTNMSGGILVVQQFSRSAVSFLCSLKRPSKFRVAGHWWLSRAETHTTKIVDKAAS
jgi:hypothetical protein